MCRKALILVLIPLAACSGVDDNGRNAEFSTGPILEDATSAAGIDFQHFNGMSGELYYCEMMGPGAALFDFDNDGDLDLYLSQGRMLGPGKTIEDATVPPPPDLPLTDRLYRNDLVITPQGARVLRFTDVTEQSGLDAAGYGMGVIVGDIDNDGLNDLYVTNFGNNQLWRNTGDGTFTDITDASGTGDERWSVSAAFVDYDRDGWLDLYVVNYTDFRWATRNPCFDVAGELDYCGPKSHTPETDRLFRNRGDGTFDNVTGPLGMLEPGPGLGVVTADFDDDGWLDIYVANDQEQNFLWMNRGDGGFANEALIRGSALDCEGKAQASMGVVAGDLDGDGDDDLYMTHLLNEANTLYLNDGAGIFLDQTRAAGLASPSKGLTGFGTALVDLDNDGLLDLVGANGEVRIVPAQKAEGDPLPLKQPNSLLLNKGGRFVDATDLAPVLAEPLVSRSVVVGDVDNDGDTDVLITNNNDRVQLLLNRIGSDAPWLGLRLVDETGRDQLGAKAALIRDGLPPIWRWARTDSSYLASNDPRVLFGLGDHPDVDRVEVRWPDGAREAFSGLEIGLYHTLVKGRGGRGDRVSDSTTLHEGRETRSPAVSQPATHIPALQEAVELGPLPPLANLADLDPLVLSQFVDRHGLIDRLLRDPRASRDGLAWAFGRLGRAYHAYQLMEPARICYQNSVFLDDTAFPWVYLLAHVDRAEGRLADSSAGFERSLELRPGSVQSLVWLAENQLELRAFDEARAGFAEAVRLDPNCAKGHLGLARVATETGSHERALEHLDRAFVLQPEAFQIHYALGMVHRAMGDTASAQAFFDMVPKDTLARVSITLNDPLMQETADLRVSAQVFARMGNKALSQGRYRVAVGYFAKAVEIDPERQDTRYNLAASLVRIGRADFAVPHLGELMERAPGHSMGHVLMARIMAARGMEAVADRHLRKALDADPEAEGVYLALADLARDRGRLDEAIGHYARAREIAPGLEDASLGVALCLIELRREAEAIDELESLLTARPDRPRPTLLLARVLSAAGRPDLRDGDRAAELAESVCRDAPTVSAGETMAMALAQIGRFEEAVAWQRAALASIASSGPARMMARARLDRYLQSQPCREPWATGERFTQRPLSPPAR